MKPKDLALIKIGNGNTRPVVYVSLGAFIVVSGMVWTLSGKYNELSGQSARIAKIEEQINSIERMTAEIPSIKQTVGLLLEMELNRGSGVKPVSHRAKSAD